MIPDVPVALGDMTVPMDGGVGGGGRGYGIGGNWPSAALWSLLKRSVESGALIRVGLLPQSSSRGLSVYMDAIGADGVRVTTVCEVGQVRLCSSVRPDQ